MIARGAAAGITLGFAAVVLSGGPSRSRNQFLAFFLVLVAINQVADLARFLVETRESGIMAYRIATVAASLDPFVLYYFASIHPKRNQLNQAWAVAAVGVPAVALAISGIIAHPVVSEYGRPPIGWSGYREAALIVFTTLAYTVVLFQFAAPLRRRGWEHGQSALFAAAVVATFPRLLSLGNLVISDLGWATGAAFPATLRGSSFPIFLAVVAVLLYMALESDTPVRSSPLVYGTGVGVAVALVVDAPNLQAWAQAIGWIENPTAWLGGTMAGIGTSIRWILFSSLGSVAVLRHSVLGLSLRARRRAARGVVTVGLLLAVGMVLLALRALLGQEGSQVRAMDLLVIALVLVTAQQFRGLIDQSAQVLYGVPPPGDRVAAIEIYQRAMEQVTAAGGDPEDDEELDELREELGLDDRSAAALHGAIAPRSEDPLELGATFRGRYQVLRHLGSGGAARVFLARDELLKRDVVLKEVEAGDGGGREDALAEARLASAIQHPNVTTVHDALERSRSVVLVTEHVAGGSLADRLAEQGPMDVVEGLAVADEILAGLEAVHEAGLVHRDLKPSNILMATDGTPKISDFGIARIRRGVTETFEPAQVLAGTPAFMAPEQIQGRVATQATDLHAVGRVLECSIREPMPAPLQDVVSVALAEDPRDRWPSARAMRQALAAAAEAL